MGQIQSIPSKLPERVVIPRPLVAPVFEPVKVPVPVRMPELVPVKR